MTSLQRPRGDLFSSQRHRHPCSEKPSVVSDIGLRLSEGIQDLKLDQQLAPTREAISRTLTAGSTNFFNAVAGVRERWMQRSVSSESSLGLTKVNSRGSVSDAASLTSRKGSADFPRNDTAATPTATAPAKGGGLRPLSIVGAQALAQAEAPKPPPVPSTFGTWGASVGSFFSQRTARLSVSSSRPPSIAGVSRGSSPVPPPVPPVPSDKEKEMPPVPPEVEAILQPKNLDEVYAPRDGDEVKVKVKAKAKDSDAASTISTGDAGFAM